MKVRSGWVSNSSTSSFMLIGQDASELLDLDDSDIRDKFEEVIEKYNSIDEHYICDEQILIGYSIGGVDEYGVDSWDIDTINNISKDVNEQLLQLCKDMNVESPEDKVHVMLYSGIRMS